MTFSRWSKVAIVVTCMLLATAAMASDDLWLRCTGTMASETKGKAPSSSSFEWVYVINLKEKSIKSYSPQKQTLKLLDAWTIGDTTFEYSNYDSFAHTHKSITISRTTGAISYQFGYAGYSDRSSADSMCKSIDPLPVQANKF
jgi:hypothetical protein